MHAHDHKSSPVLHSSKHTYWTADGIFVSSLCCCRCCFSHAALTARPTSLWLRNQEWGRTIKEQSIWRAVINMSCFSGWVRRASCGTEGLLPCLVLPCWRRCQEGRARQGTVQIQVWTDIPAHMEGRTEGTHPGMPTWQQSVPCQGQHLLKNRPGGANSQENGSK